MTTRTSILAASLAALVALAGCQDNRDAAARDATASIEDTVGTQTKSAIEKARIKLASENISISSNATGADAEITPQGDLLIDGKAVQVTPEQRRLLLEYREHLVGVASAGMDVGLKGADLAVDAAGEAIRGIFGGNPEQIEQRVQERAGGIREAALKICDRLPAMREAQDRLAAALPEFAPFADLDQSDVDECRRDAGNGTPPAPPVPPAPPTPPAPTAG